MISYLRGVLKLILRFPANLVAEVLVSSSTKLPALLSSLLLKNPTISGKFYPHQRYKASYVIPKPDYSDNSENPDRITGLPMPPRELWAGYAETAERWLYLGKRDVDGMLDIIRASGFSFEHGSRIMELGCASGRMMRWLHEFAEDCEIWGIDISAPHISWCRHYLSPPFHFVTVTSLPHVPFEDNYFEFIYAGSVFTHISELADAWLMELRRILRPGGRLYITVHDKNTIDSFVKKTPDFWLTKMLLSSGKEFMESDFGMFAINRAPKGAQVFYDIDYLCREWGHFFEIVSITEKAYGYQTAVLLAKP